MNHPRAEYSLGQLNTSTTDLRRKLMEYIRLHNKPVGRLLDLSFTQAPHRTSGA